jgi:hypothetical protein
LKSNPETKLDFPFNEALRVSKVELNQSLIFSEMNDDYEEKASKLRKSDTLLKGQKLTSNNEKYELVLQNDNNLVVYEISNNSTRTVVWNGDSELKSLFQERMMTFNIERLTLDSNNTLRFIIKEKDDIVWRTNIASFALSNFGELMFNELPR